jgi:hypothetical protein
MRLAVRTEADLDNLRLGCLRCCLCARIALHDFAGCGSSALATCRHQSWLPLWQVLPVTTRIPGTPRRWPRLKRPASPAPGRLLKPSTPNDSGKLRWTSQNSSSTTSPSNSTANSPNTAATSPAAGLAPRPFSRRSSPSHLPPSRRSWPASRSIRRPTGTFRGGPAVAEDRARARHAHPLGQRPPADRPGGGL